MKIQSIQSITRTASVAVIVVLGMFVAVKAAHASDSVFFHQDSSGNITCYTTNHPQTGTSCTDDIYNNGAAGGESLNWTSVSESPSASWLTVSPTTASNIQPGSDTPVFYSVQSSMAPGTYTTTVSFNGQSVSPSGTPSVTPDTATVQYIVDSPTPSAPSNPTTSNTAGNASVACGTIQLTWTAAANATSYNIFRNGTLYVSQYAGTSYTDTNVAAGTSYSYTIQSYNATYGTTSSTVAFTPSSIQDTACVTMTPPTNPVNSNSSGSSGVACGTIQLTWTAAANATSYNIFRNGTLYVSQYAGTSYTDTNVAAGTSYSYTIQSYNATYGTSSAIPFSPASIQPTACEVDLSLSDDLISTVNLQPYPFTSQCVGSQSGTAAAIQESEVVALRVDICNTGTAAAQNVVLSSNFDTKLYNTEYTSAYLANGETTPSGYTNVTSTGRTVNWNVGTVNPNTNQTVYVYIEPYVGESTSQALQRFINSASISYTAAAGNVSPGGCLGNYANASQPCIVSTGYVPFNLSGSSTTQQEIAP